MMAKIPDDVQRKVWAMRRLSGHYKKVAKKASEEAHELARFASATEAAALAAGSPAEDAAAAKAREAGVRAGKVNVEYAALLDDETFKADVALLSADEPSTEN